MASTWASGTMGREGVPASGPAAVVLGSSPWPTVFELNRGETITLRNGSASTTVKLLDVSHTFEADHWTGKSPNHAVFASARIAVEVNGQRAELLCRPYEMPRAIGGVRLYVETTKQWAQTPQLHEMKDVGRDVRFTAVAEGRSWGPDTLLFPVANYRWRSATYQNTWNSLVPFNLLYYHRGEDLGAIPDKLDLVAVLDGRVSATPLPKGDGRSNGLALAFDNTASLRYAHMNIETIRPELTQGAEVKRGQILAKTGCTWAGRRSQHDDPHVHMGLKLDQTDISFYPALVEAYFRTYGDPLIAVAGGFGFVEVGGQYELDGSRSLARPGRKIVAHRWRLHDGREVDGPRHVMRYDQPGYFAEELIVRGDDGSEDRDAIHVRVYDPREGRKIAMGWVYYAPSRAIKAGDEMVLHSRLRNLEGRGTIDFGDGSAADGLAQQVTHVYKQAGLYTVTIAGRGPRGEAVLHKVRVLVE